MAEYIQPAGTDENEIQLLRVRDFWNSSACGSITATSPKFTKKYFEEIEAYRYSAEPQVFSFAQFTRHHGQRVLEIGIGAATDFLQWVRAGASAHGVDLTEEAVEHAQRRLALYGLNATEIRTANAENLPYPDSTFDVVYSWGVLHHSPNTARALSEAIRVAKPGGTCKIMLYHRRSLVALYVWLRYAALRLRPWRSVRWCIFHHMESYGTKAFSRKEIMQMLAPFQVHDICIKTILTCQDRLEKHNRFFRFGAKILAHFGGSRVGFYMTIQFQKKPAAVRESILEVDT